ncbi:Transcriptional regulator, LysR family [hydrothermal vent metagenome]|uniref:Transcriptional regulator, LysR family n=1 Tax=hydrothermal vent metagenome TaxID=652676 RepID=A0A3B1A6P1_9ZZZZ
MTLDLNAMALFVHVVENKSFSETAKRVGIPISTVSRKISELEKSLGIRLLERTTRKLRLTEIGQEYFEYCRRGLEEFETGTLMINDKQAEISGTLRLSAPPNLGEALIVPIICAFQARYPKVKIKVFITERNLDFIKDGVDIALRVGDLDDSTLIARELIQYRHLLVSSKKYLTSAKVLNSPADLVSHLLITFGGWHAPSILKLSNQGETHKIKINEMLSINDYAGIIYAIEKGRGIAEIPSIVCDSLLKSGRVVEVLPNWHLPSTKLSVVYPSNKNIYRMARLFIDFCVEHIKDWQPN